MKTEKSNFPLNAWYAAAYDVEVGRSLLPRTLCNQKLVLFRKEDGSVAALEDACWHRLMPLSLGRLQGDEVTCGYHGLVFNAQGRCTHMPSQETLNPSACVRSFPVQEQYILSGSGRATRRWRTRSLSPTCTGTTTRPGPVTAR